MATQKLDNPSRRFMLKSSAMAVAFSASPAVNALQAFSIKQSLGTSVASLLASSPYGPIAPVRDEVTGLEFSVTPAFRGLATP